MTIPADLLPAAPTETFQIGALVRSYDFPGTWDCYVEGYIAGYGGDTFPSDVHYKVAVTKRVWEGRQVADSLVPELVYPPMRGSLGRRLVYRVSPPPTARCLHCWLDVPEMGGKYWHVCTPPAPVRCAWDDWKPARDL